MCVPRIHMSRRVHAIRRCTSALARNIVACSCGRSRAAPRARAHGHHVCATAMASAQLLYCTCVYITSDVAALTQLSTCRKYYVYIVVFLLLTYLSSSSKFFSAFFSSGMPLFFRASGLPHIYEKMTLVGAVAPIVYEVKKLYL